MRRLIPLLLLVGCGPATSDSPLVLNEFVALNASGLAGPDLDFPDWIELHNPTGEDLPLAGFALSDDADDLGKHAFDPSLFVPAGGYVVVFADGEEGLDRVGFRLSADGEALILSELVDDVWAVVDGLTFGVQAADVSAARLPDATGEWAFDDTPTPGAPND